VVLSPGQIQVDLDPWKIGEFAVSDAGADLSCYGCEHAGISFWWRWPILRAQAFRLPGLAGAPVLHEKGPARVFQRLNIPPSLICDPSGFLLRNGTSSEAALILSRSEFERARVSSTG
jgi:hypothetical protein